MIFDDVMLKDQFVIKDYFCRGRHNNASVFHLCQSLHKIAKHCIRENANMFILFKQDDKTLKYFHETVITGDIDFIEFKQFCDGAWSKRHSFVVINQWNLKNVTVKDVGQIMIVFTYRKNILFINNI